MPILAPDAFAGIQTNGWSAALGGIAINGGTELCDNVVSVGCLTDPPDGMGMPPLRTQDKAFLQGDGVAQFEDYYEPRIVTLQVAVGTSSCGCSDVRSSVQQIVNAWRRRCSGDSELVIFPPQCDDPELSRPLGILGRPRVAQVQYTQQGTANLVLRFDAKDQLMYLLDDCGEPGSGIECALLTPDIQETCRQYDRCYTACSPGVTGWTYPVSTGVSGGGPVDFEVVGTECLYPTVTLYGNLTTPIIEDVETGAMFLYNDIVSAGSPVTINLQEETASEGNADRTLDLTVTGGPMTIQVGSNTWRLRSFSSDDDGYAEVCWRPAVIVG